MTRLVARARQLEADPNVLLARFVLERLLYRLSVSPHRGRFVLKGATLMPIWLGETARPTRDADLAGFGDLSNESLRAIFADLCEFEVMPDGIIFDAKTIRVNSIRRQDEYGGRRVKLTARIGRSKIPVQIDVGIGDVVWPPPAEVELTPILDFPPTRLRAYRPETSIAEKFHAIVSLGTANSRMKDFYDIDRLAANLSFNANTLRQAIQRTFERRGTALPSGVPDSLTEEFATQTRKQAEWSAFAGRVTGSDRFEDVVARIRDFLLPALNRKLAASWRVGGPWQTSPGSEE